MKTDATTKLLLAALAGALWVIALRPVITPVPVAAQQPQAETDTRPAVVIGGRGVYVVEHGRIYRFLETLGQPASIGEYGPNVKARSEKE